MGRTKERLNDLLELSPRVRNKVGTKEVSLIEASPSPKAAALKTNQSNNIEGTAGLAAKHCAGHPQARGLRVSNCESKRIACLLQWLSWL